VYKAENAQGRALWRVAPIHPGIGQAGKESSNDRSGRKAIITNPWRIKYGLSRDFQSMADCPNALFQKYSQRPDSPFGGDWPDCVFLMGFSHNFTFT